MPLPPSETVALIVIAILVVVLIVMLAVRAQRTRHLREQFGPEYDRTVANTADRAKAEAALSSREKKRERFQSRELDQAALRRFKEQWRVVQVRFVDDPSNSVREADGLVNQVMLQRGYPMDTFDQRASDISVDYPRVVENYRQAHQISLANDRGEASTEDLRRSLIYYRSLFDELLATRDQSLKETG